MWAAIVRSQRTVVPIVGFGYVTLVVVSVGVHWSRLGLLRLLAEGACLAEAVVVVLASLNVRLGRPRT